MFADANNFNDLASGIVTCFELLVVNNWYVIEGGFELVSDRAVVRFFFTAVYVIGVLVCLNIVTAAPAPSPPWPLLPTRGCCPGATRLHPPPSCSFPRPAL